MRSSKESSLNQTPMHTVRFDDGASGPGYGLLVANIYHEQAARLIQRKIRRMRIKQHKKVSKPKVEPILKNPASLGIFQEPTDNKYLEHVAKIKAWQYRAMDFYDPEFTRNIYKALRLGTITLNEMLMAKQIFDAKLWLQTKGEIPATHEFEYTDPNGPYQASSIVYATSEQVAAFHASLGESDKKYITINFTKRVEAFFFQYGMSCQLYKHSRFFSGMLEKYMQQSMLSESDKNIFFRCQSMLMSDDPYIQGTAINKIKTFIQQIASASEPIPPRSIDAGSICFLCSILKLDEQNPSLVVSPDFDPTNPKSPVVCFVLPTLEAVTQLQFAVHGRETTMPMPTTGKMGTRLIRDYDEYWQARPFEVEHPDVDRTETPHKYLCYPFLLTFHDHFHAWRNGANFKALFRHMRNLLTKKGVCQNKPFLMSHGIWQLTDLDYSLGSILRELELKLKKEAPIRGVNSRLPHQALIDCLLEIMTSLNIKCYGSDMFFLVLIDMINNHVAWEKIISSLPIDPEYCDIHKLMTIQEPDLALDEEEIVLKSWFATAFEDRTLVKIIQENKGLPNESIILRCRMRFTPNASALCEAIEQIGLTRFFYWGANSGLYIQPQLRSFLSNNYGVNNFSLDNYYDRGLFHLLLVCVGQLGTQEQYHALLIADSVRAEDEDCESWTTEALDTHEYEISNRKRGRDSAETNYSLPENSI